MPKGRMLNKKISQDEKVAKLSLKATLFYTWCIPYLDIKGRMYGDIWTLKAIVPHIEEITPQNIPQIIQEMVSQDLVVYYGDDIHKYLEFKGFKNNQKLNPDKEAESIIPTPDLLLTNSGVTLPKVKISKVKISKDVQDLFSYFLLKTKKAFRLTDSNKLLIESRLKDYTLEQIKKAVDNFVLDTWEDRIKHMDLVYCIGIRNKIDNLDKWLNIKAKQEFKKP